MNHRSVITLAMLLATMLSASPALGQTRCSAPSARQAFVATNAASFTPTLVATELSVHVRGAFTGAVQHRRGLFEQAERGNCSSTRSACCRWTPRLGCFACSTTVRFDKPAPSADGVFLSALSRRRTAISRRWSRHSRPSVIARRVSEPRAADRHARSLAGGGVPRLRPLLPWDRTHGRMVWPAVRSPEGKVMFATRTFDDVRNDVHKRADRMLRDHVVHISDLRMTPEGHLHAPGTPAYRMNDWARRQLASRRSRALHRRARDTEFCTPWARPISW